jgi:hypothetical protein
VWVLKADDGRLPVPGASAVKQSFFEQGTLDLGEDVFEPNLTLSCPRSGKATRDSVSEFFHVPLPDPTDLLSRQSHVQMRAAAEAEDLDEITPRSNVAKISAKKKE